MKKSHVHGRYRPALVALLSIVLAAAGVSFVATSAQAAAGCRVDYSVTNQWSGGFGANVSVTNLGEPLTSWQLTWAFANGQTVTDLWSGSYTQTGAQVTVTNAAWNGTLATGASTSFGFNGAFTTANPVPAAFALNGTACTGAVTSTPSTTPPTTTPPTTPPTSGGTCTLPSSYRWSSSGALAQ
ncbi:cellulose-binding domain-containing protein, partial [Streptomyces sp. NPDC021224]|uniref:cellulose-binding domain-containing protein n=1 Tax=unclassified Streptomyces TaxID=2593676 RepID=UPI0037A459D7